MKHELKPYINAVGGLALLLTCPLVIGQSLDREVIEADSNFGCSIAGIGDMDGDRVSDIAVGVNSRERTAYVFSGIDGNFLFTLDDKALPTDADSDSDCSLAQMANTDGESVVGDVTGDSVPDIAVAEPGQGRVLVFSGEDGELVYTLNDPNQAPAVDSSTMNFTICGERYKYVQSGDWRTLESFWNATGSAFFRAPAGATIKVRYGVGWFGKDRQKQTLNGFDYKKLDIGAWSVTYARMQMRVSSSTYVTYIVCPGGLGTSFPPIPF